MAFGKLSNTTPFTSITSSLGFFTLCFFLFDSLPFALASFFPNNAVEEVPNTGTVQEEDGEIT
jgi:hypothetical protein